MQKIQKKLQFFQLLNKLRQQPHTQIQSISKTLSTFKNQTQYYQENIPYNSKQGKKPWLQSIQFLKRQIPIKELLWSQGLHIAAKQYAKNLNYAKKCDPFQFIQQQVTYTGEIRIWMNCSCASIKHFLNYAIVSDGDLSRDQRKSLFNPKYKYFGSSFTKNEKYGNVLIYFLAESVESKKNEKITANKLIKQINKIRANPKCYIHELQSQISLFKDKKIIFNKNQILQTYQGKSAWIECIQYLNTKSPVPQLNYLKQLNKIALKKSRYPQIPFSKFIKKFDIDGKARFIENFGTADSKQILTNLIVSDGDPTRITRNTIFSEQFNCVGGFIDITPNQQNSGLLFIQIKQVGFNNKSGQQTNNLNNQRQYLNLISHDFLNNKILQNRVKSSLENYTKLRINSIPSKSTNRKNYFNQKFLNNLSQSNSNLMKQGIQTKPQREYKSVRYNNLINIQKNSSLNK